MNKILRRYFFITIFTILLSFLAKTFLPSVLMYFNNYDSYERVLDNILFGVGNILYIFLLTLPLPVWLKCKKDFLPLTTLCTLILFSIVFSSDVFGVFGEGSDFNDLRLFFVFISFLMAYFVEVVTIALYTKK